MSDPNISINVLKDLDSKSALVKMLQGQIGTEFPMLGTLTQYADKPISEAAPMNVENSSSTQKLSAKLIDGSVYVNVDLNFRIQGTVSGTAPAGTVGISGKVSGSQAASHSFCFPVASTWSARSFVPLDELV